MSVRLIPHWEFRGSDWITSIDVIKGKYIFVGSRNGSFYILNWYGAKIFQKDFGSWIGAIKVVEVIDRSHEDSINPVYILLGTKRGDVICEQFTANRTQGVELAEVCRLKAQNTVREIDVTSGVQAAEDTWVTVGSEDKHVYIVNFGDLLLKNNQAQVKGIEINGWIRSAAFCKYVDNEKTLIAAGCGDKHLYFFNLSGEEEGKVFVDSKIHSIVSDQSSSKLYCTSDAKKLYVIGWQGFSYGIIEEKDLPHRATKLAFMDDEFRRILVVCEDLNIYVFDTDERELYSWIRVGQRVFSIKDASWNKTDLLLLGHAYGKLSCFMYSLERESPTPALKSVKGFIGDFDPSSLSKLAEHMIFGPKSHSLQVGIGRFLHLPLASANNLSVCILGTDGGDVVVISLKNGTDRAIFYKTGDMIKHRVWAVYGYWESDKHLKIYVATSEKKVLQYVLRTDVSPPALAAENHISLKDWPREIRPVHLTKHNDERQLLISCENGDLLIYDTDNNSIMAFNNKQIFRTGYAKQVSEGEYEILTGSDNNLITYYKNTEQIWIKETLDKVREVIITENECLAVSEDRYLYVLNHEGQLKFKYRFPHRALCIDRYFDYRRNVWFVVGCGDGYVYFVNDHGFIKEAYEFPDRIRDIKIVNNEEIIVACEDRKVYFAPTVDKLLKDYYGDKHLEFIESKLVELQRNINTEGLIAVNNLSEEERLILLMYVNEWFKPANVDLVVYLLDSTKQFVIEKDILKLYYIYASALIVLAIKGNFAAGKFRIEDYIDHNINNSYALHSMLATITHHRIKSWRMLDTTPPPIVTIDTIVAHLPLEDAWILEECVRHLYHAGFFSFSEGGFCHFFETVQISYNKLSQIIDYAIICEITDIHTEDVVKLIRHLKGRQFEPQEFELILRDLNNSEIEVKDCLNELNFVTKSSEEIDQILLHLEDWVDNKVVNQGMKAICKESIGECFARTTFSQSQFSLVADLLENKLFRFDCQISARDYLYIMFCCSFMWALSNRFDARPQSDVNDVSV